MSTHFNALTGQFLLSEQLIPAGNGQHYDLQNGSIVFGDLLVPKLGGTLFDDAVLDLNFAATKSLTDSVSGNNLITFTRASSGTYIDSNGLIQSAAVDTPRFDHDPSTGESLGLLVEESRTNSIPQSEDITGYNLRHVTTPLDSSAVNPAGSLGSYKINAQSGSSTGGVRVHYNATSANNIVVSAFVKKSTHRYALVGFGGTTNHFTAVFDIEPGLTSNRLLGQDKKGTSSNRGAGYQDFPNDWVRIWAVGTTSGANGPTVGMSPNASTFTIKEWTSAGTEEIYAWGLQWEDDARFPTSYIPTSGSTVTRAADVATIDNSGGSVFNIDQFTTINKPFGRSKGSTTLTLLPADPAGIQRVSVFDQYLPQETINNASDAEDDGFWRWRILGGGFALSSFSTDGQVTVDWGDGTVETLTTSVHSYTDSNGYHEVGFRLDSGTYFRPYINVNTTHKDKVIAIGPAPESMKLDAEAGFYGCSALEAFDATVNATGGTSLLEAWRGCSSLTSFPLINTSGVTSFRSTWRACSSLTNFPLIDTSSGTTFFSAWYDCTSLTSFPAIDVSSAVSFRNAWYNCSSLTNFPANFFDSWTGTPADSCFSAAWSLCTSLTATSVENILNSIDTSGRSAPAAGKTIDIAYDTGTGTPSVATAVTNLNSRNWQIKLNGVVQ